MIQVLILRCSSSGMAHLVFNKTGNHYTWRKVSTTVHNIIVGKLWVDNHGEMDIKNHFNGDNCHLKYNAYSFFSKEPPRKVRACVCVTPLEVQRPTAKKGACVCACDVT